jgi:hypothetical protein
VLVSQTQQALTCRKDGLSLRTTALKLDATSSALLGTAGWWPWQVSIAYRPGGPHFQPPSWFYLRLLLFSIVWQPPVLRT